MNVSHTTSPSLWILGLLFALPPLGASAHRLDATARVEGGKIQVTARYADGSLVERFRYEVSDGRGRALRSGENESAGTLDVAPIRNSTLQIEIQDSSGHKATLVIPAEMLAEALAGASGELGAEATTRPAGSMFLRGIAGLAAIFGVGGVAAFILARRERIKADDAASD